MVGKVNLNKNFDVTGLLNSDSSWRCSISSSFSSFVKNLRLGILIFLKKPFSLSVSPTSLTQQRHLSPLPQFTSSASIILTSLQGLFFSACVRLWVRDYRVFFYSSISLYYPCSNKCVVCLNTGVTFAKILLGFSFCFQQQSLHALYKTPRLTKW